MIYVRQIMEMFQCDQALATQVVNAMYLDFSEASEDEFRWAANNAYRRVWQRNNL